MHRPVTESLRHARLFSKTVTLAVLAAFLSLILQPLALAANLPAVPKAMAKATVTATDPSAQLAQTLEATEAKLGELIDDFTAGRDANPRLQDLTALHQQLKSLDQAALQSFAEVETHLKAKALPQVILDRHTDAVKSYTKEFQTLTNALTALEAAPDNPGRKKHAEAAFNHLKEKQKKRGRPPFDPNDLPNKSLQPDPNNKPKLTKAQFIQAGLTDNPTVKLAAHGTFTFDKLPGASDPAYLAATAEVTLTPAIQAKATELDHNPVKIYNWVRNNVEWLPTWGATQDADVTLGSKRGNALDIASLLIALYRASGIPARYVHGTIEVSADKYMNWAGGFTDITAAGNYASSGGIPITGIVTGGKITKFQLEHIWVEAAIDFIPSRGAINKSADQWVALDASYKQYEYVVGVDITGVSGINFEALARSYLSSGTINETEGWESGLDTSIFLNARTQARVALDNYIRNNMTNPTVRDVIGGRKIIEETRSILPTGLPNRLALTGARYGVLPGALQNRMGFTIFQNVFGIPSGEVSVLLPWAKLNNHRITLSFRPATSADEQTLLSFVPARVTDPSQLPSSIPSYLINVVPEIAVDGEVVATGSTMRLGEELGITSEASLTNSTPIVRTYSVPAGSYLSLAAMSGRASPEVLLDAQRKIEQTKATLESGNENAIRLLDREELLGDLFHVGTLSYFGQYNMFSDFAGLVQQGQQNLAAGFGSLGYEPNVSYFFGFPRAITKGWVAVNVWVVNVIGMTKDNTSKRRDFQLQLGILSSALEHSVPEQLFSTPTQPAQGVSAVKALRMASEQGQRVYHITPANQATVLPNLHLDGLALSEITQALSVGKEVVAHTDRINIAGWTGEGYILFDPVTGAGAYKITGGSNGAFVTGLIAGPALFVSLMTAVIAFFGIFTAFAAWWLLLIVAIIAVVVWTYVILQMSVTPVAGCFKAGFHIGSLGLGFVITASHTIHGILFAIDVGHAYHDAGEFASCGTS